MGASDLAIRVRQIVQSNRYLTMGTTDGSEPWVAPLAYALTKDYNFLYYSAVDSRHSLHIAVNPVVACAIFDSTAPSDDADGVQFKGRVFEVLDEELDAAMDWYFKQSFPDEEIRKRWLRPREDFIAPAIQRFYRIQPTELYALDMAQTKVDRRVPLNLQLLLHE